jgi:hypothetical protein
MVNKDQLDQTGEGKQVLALMAEHFTAEQFQPALTLIEQWYTEDQTVWDADLNKDSKLPFLKTNPAHRLLVFFDSPNHLAKIKDELERRAAEHPIKTAEASAGKSQAGAKPKAKGETNTKTIGTSQKARAPKKPTAKVVKKKAQRPQRSNQSKKRTKPNSPRAKVQKSRGKKTRGSSASHSSGRPHKRKHSSKSKRR